MSCWLDETYDHETKHVYHNPIPERDVSTHHNCNSQYQVCAREITASAPNILLLDPSRVLERGRLKRMRENNPITIKKYEEKMPSATSRDVSMKREKKVGAKYWHAATEIIIIMALEIIANSYTPSTRLL